ncbi:MAG TPA: HAMP domain-containing sensor histidine kinase [Blastocatellia bacterium]
MARTIKPLKWYQQLRWKLSLLYIAATVGVVLMGLCLTQVMSYFSYRRVAQPVVLEEKMTTDARELGALASTTAASHDSLVLWLKGECARFRDGVGGWRGLSFYSNPSIYSEVDRPDGTVWASHSYPTEISEQTIASTREGLISSVLANGADGHALVAREGRNALAGAVPIIDRSGRMRGIFYMRVEAPFNWLVNWQHVAHGLAYPLIMIVAFAIVGGMGFGIVTARYLVNRLDRISQAAEGWAHGDFTAVATDCHIEDEVGQLSRQLNSMLEELRGFLALKQELATLEERNRLARDLHDTVKQQAFALSMQIGAAQSMLNGDNPNVSARLAEAENLAQQVQHELVSIIEKLRPQDASGKECGPGKEFDVMLREHVARWSRQSGVIAEVKSDRAIVLPSAVEQALFRILQEALANILRHSGASHASVEFSQPANGRVTLSVTDDGDGFDPSDTNGGIGLKSMRERAEALPGGRLVVEAQRGKGVRIAAGCDTRALA